MKTKHWFLFCLMAALMFATSSCNKSDHLREQVELLNSQCPITAVEDMEIVAVTYEEDVVEIKCEVNENLVSVQKIKENKDLFRRNGQMMITNSTGSFADLIKELKKAGAGLKMTYHGRQSDETISLTFTSEEIEKASEIKDSDKNPEDLLDSQIQMTNIQCPMTVDEVTTMVGLTKDDKYVIYQMSIDDNQVDMRLLGQNAAELKQEIKSNLLNSSDPSLDGFLRVVKETKRGVCYLYTGANTKIQKKVIIEYSEL